MKSLEKLVPQIILLSAFGNIISSIIWSLVVPGDERWFTRYFCSIVCLGLWALIKKDSKDV